MTYAKQNGGSFDWIVQDGAVPLTQEFWTWLISTSIKWGLQMYEQGTTAAADRHCYENAGLILSTADWLYTEFVGVNGTFLRSATLGRQVRC